MYYVYVLKSTIDGNLYFGYTTDLKERVFCHNAGKVKSTKGRRPLKLVYYEAYLSKLDATKREFDIKKGQQREIIKERLKNSLTGGVA
ncbi:MAG: GIY-YIG nuclease family protein [Patescibacteria group bacterium]